MTVFASMAVCLLEFVTSAASFAATLGACLCRNTKPTITTTASVKSIFVSICFRIVGRVCDLGLVAFADRIPDSLADQVLRPYLPERVIDQP